MKAHHIHARIPFRYVALASKSRVLAEADALRRANCVVAPLDSPKIHTNEVEQSYIPHDFSGFASELPVDASLTVSKNGFPHLQQHNFPTFQEQSSFQGFHATDPTLSVYAIHSSEVLWSDNPTSNAIVFGSIAKHKSCTNLPLPLQILQSMHLNESLCASLWETHAYLHCFAVDAKKLLQTITPAELFNHHKLAAYNDPQVCKSQHSHVTEFLHLLHGGEIMLLPTTQAFLQEIEPPIRNAKSFNDATVLLPFQFWREPAREHPLQATIAYDAAKLYAGIHDKVLALNNVVSKPQQQTSVYIGIKRRQPHPSSDKSSTDFETEQEHLLCSILGAELGGTESTAVNPFAFTDEWFWHPDTVDCIEPPKENIHTSERLFEVFSNADTADLQAMPTLYINSFVKHAFLKGFDSHMPAMLPLPHVSTTSAYTHLNTANVFQGLHIPTTTFENFAFDANSTITGNIAACAATAQAGLQQLQHSWQSKALTFIVLTAFRMPADVITRQATELVETKKEDDNIAEMLPPLLECTIGLPANNTSLSSLDVNTLLHGIADASLRDIPDKLRDNYDKRSVGAKRSRPKDDSNSSAFPRVVAACALIREIARHMKGDVIAVDVIQRLFQHESVCKYWGGLIQHSVKESTLLASVTEQRILASDEKQLETVLDQTTEHEAQEMHSDGSADELSQHSHSSTHASSVISSSTNDVTPTNIAANKQETQKAVVIVGDRLLQDISTLRTLESTSQVALLERDLPPCIDAITSFSTSVCIVRCAKEPAASCHFTQLCSDDDVDAWVADTAEHTHHYDRVYIIVNVDSGGFPMFMRLQLGVVNLPCVIHYRFLSHHSTTLASILSSILQCCKDTLLVSDTQYVEMSLCSRWEEKVSGMQLLSLYTALALRVAFSTGISAFFESDAAVALQRVGVVKDAEAISPLQRVVVVKAAEEVSPSYGKMGRAVQSLLRLHSMLSTASCN